MFNYLFYYFPSPLIASTFELCAYSVANVKYPVCPCISFSGLPVKMFALLAFCDITARTFRTSPVAGSVSVNLRGLGLDVAVPSLFDISDLTSVSQLLGNSLLVGIFSVVWSPAFSRSSGKLGDVYYSIKKKKHVDTNITLYCKKFLIYSDRNAAFKAGPEVIRRPTGEVRLLLLIGCQTAGPQIAIVTVADTTSMCRRSTTVIFSVTVFPENLFSVFTSHAIKTKIETIQ